MKNNFDMKKDLDIAWCPGCGDYGILDVLKKALSELNYEPKTTVLVSGIGQAAKTPQYVNANFFNGLHGRALPPATGISLANPKLKVIVTSGDGDMYGEGGNHFIHAIRRNPNITVFVYNNMIYGLTKGQASPTSQLGMKTPVQTNGVFLEPFNPLSVAISLDCSFVARASIADPEKTKEIMKKALEHKGFSLVDIFQPCVSFNKLNTYDWFRENTYYIDENYDYYDKTKAFEKSQETEKFPLGIFYISKDKLTFNEFMQKVNEDNEPLYNHEVRNNELEKLIKSKIEKASSSNTSEKIEITKDENYLLEIIEEWDETHNVKSFVLKTSDDFKFSSGQHVMVSFKDNREVNNKTKIPLSISNPPTDKNKIILTFKNMGGFTKELSNLKVGDKLSISKPFGNDFVFDEKNNNNYIILSGGTGITPFMSIIRFILAKNKTNKIILFNGNLTQNDIIFNEELNKINSEQENIRVINVLSNPTDTCQYDCKGFIDENTIKDYVDNLQDYKFMICGPPPMISAMHKVLDNLQIKKEDIFCEEWKIENKEEKISVNDSSTTLQHKDKVVNLNPGPIMNAAEELGVPFMCRQGICGTCTVKVIEGMDNLEEKNDKETSMGLDDDQRLCCQAKIKSGNVKIDF